MLGILAACTVVGYLFRGLGLKADNIIMVYILGVLGVSMSTTGRSYSLISSAFSVLIFNFFFTFPYFSLVSEPSYLATFGIMFIVALLGSSLTTRIKRQAIQSANKAYRTEVLLETSRKLQTAEGTEEILSVTATQLGKLLERDLLIYPVREDGRLAEAMCFPTVSGADMSGYLTSAERRRPSGCEKQQARRSHYRHASQLSMPVYGGAAGRSGSWPWPELSSSLTAGRIPLKRI